MSVLRSIVQEEYDRLKSLLKMYYGDIRAFPKGSISVKNIGNGQYAYLAYRDKGKVNFDYLGPVDSEKVREMNQKIEERRKYESLIKRAQSNLEEAGRMLSVRAN